MTKNKIAFLRTDCLIPADAPVRSSPPTGAVLQAINIDPQWLSDNNWCVLLEGLNSGYPNGGCWFRSIDEYRAITEPALAVLQEYNIPTYLMLNSMVNAYSTCSQPAVSNPPSWYADKYNVYLTDIETRWGPGGSLGDIFTGYWYEQGSDYAAQWLRGVTDLEIRWGWNWYVWGLPSIIVNDYQTRLANYVDGVDMEVWCVADLFSSVGQIAAAQYIRANYPNISLGVDSMPFDTPPTIHHYWTYFSYYHHWPSSVTSDPDVSIQEQMMRYSAFLTYFKDAVGAFDVLCAEFDWCIWSDPPFISYPPDEQTENVCIQYQLAYQDSVGLTEGGATQINLTNIAYPT